MPPETVSDADFRILGLEPGSKPSEVRRAYRALVKEWHPDRHHLKSYEEKALAEKRFREIDEAYRRIAQDLKESAVPGQDAPKRSSRPRQARAVKVRPYVPRFPWIWPKVDFSGFLISRYLAPGLAVLVLAMFVLYQLPQLLQDSSFDGTHPGQLAENQAGQGENNQDPPGEAAPRDLTTEPPSVPQSLLIKPEPEPPSTFFTLGSSTSEVLRVQGAPTRVQGQTWIYELSEIQFRNGRVWRYNNFDGSLRVRMQPVNSSGEEKPSYITIGSSEDEVLEVHGTPTRVEGEKWFYGFSELRFKNGRVKEYENYFGSLKVRLFPSANHYSDSVRHVFTIGSTPDEVLAVQGTPTSVQGNRWSYNFATVNFREGRVQSVTNSDGTLHFASPDEVAGNAG